MEIESNNVGSDGRFEVVYPLRFSTPRRIFEDELGSLPPLKSIPQCFPTIYWLIDAALDQQLAGLERDGWIRRLQAQILADAELLAGLKADHQAYRDARRAMLLPEHQPLVEQSNSLTRAFRGGVGGVANFRSLKCLHAHYAYHLARETHGGTTVGRLVDEVLSQPRP